MSSPEILVGLTVLPASSIKGGGEVRQYLDIENENKDVARDRVNWHTSLSARPEQCITAIIINIFAVAIRHVPCIVRHWDGI